MSLIEDECYNEQEFEVQSPKSKKIKKSESLSPRKNQGHWTTEEHEKYLQFLDDHTYWRKNNKIFKPMSELIGTRSPSQCRSHHQKFNPLSPQIQRKIQKNQKKQQQTPSTLQEETNYFSQEIEDPNKNRIQLFMFDEEEYQEPLNHFNLDELI